jgi:hypothetical protein
VIRHCGTGLLAVEDTRPSCAVWQRTNLVVGLVSSRNNINVPVKLTIKPMYSYESTVKAFSGRAIPQVYPPHETLENSPSPTTVPLDSELV